MSAKYVAPGLAIVAFVFGFPTAQIMIHGFDISLWPVGVKHPSDWFAALISSYGLNPLGVYADLLFSRTNGVGIYGRLAFLWIFVIPGIAILACFIPRTGPRRDPNAAFGDARWATRRERARMQIGLELGLDPDTSRPVRVMVESHLVSIHAPGTGKTSGLCIPNLAAPSNTNWHGPSVVFDPKGEIYRAVGERRRKLGRVVRCFDPTGIVGGADTWNPVKTIDTGNILYLQRVARSLLSQEVSGDGAYFRDSAVAVIVGAFLAASALGNATPAMVSKLLSNVDAFNKAIAPLEGVAVENAKAVLKMEAKGRDSILSTAARGFDWCADERPQRATNTSSFDLNDLCGGEVDLFIALPAEDLETLAPLMRWMLCDLFTAVRRRRPLERIVCFIDEAQTIFGGRFKEFLLSVGELPGHNLSIWSFWQSRSQITSTFGKDGAQTLLNTAEITTFSDLPLVDPDERELLSRSIGDYTLIEKVTTKDEKTGKTSTSERPTAVRLMSADAVGQIPAGDLIVFPNSKRYPKRPLQIRKTAYDDPRLRGLIVGTSGRAVT
jgi:type IV secretion system protein VirD4